LGGGRSRVVLRVGWRRSVAHCLRVSELRVGLEHCKMNEKPLSYFEKAIMATYGVGCELVRRELVVERFEGELVWEGEVLVFKLLDHPTALWCYAWTVEGEVMAVLHEPPVLSAVAAVRAAISSDE
jgi:hypothetical protein